MFIVFSGFSVLAQVTPEYEQTVKRMLQATGAEENFKVTITEMMKIYKETDDRLSPSDWDLLEKELLTTSLDDLVGMLAPIYAKHFTLSELNQIIEFWNSPIGKKFAARTPEISREAMAVGQEWGEQLGQKVADKILQYGN